MNDGLLNRIDLLRNELNKAIEKNMILGNDLTGDDVINLSRLLDKEILKYYEDYYKSENKNNL